MSPLTDEQLKLRLTGVTGSEIAALVGMNPYVQPIEIWEGKMNPRPSLDNHHTLRGKFYERPTADWWAHLHGATLRETGTLVHPRNPIVIATPDFIAKTDEGE